MSDVIDLSEVILAAQARMKERCIAVAEALAGQVDADGEPGEAWIARKIAEAIRDLGPNVMDDDDPRLEVEPE